MKKIQKTKKKNVKYYVDIINKIEKVRSKNNTNWMNILRIAFKHSPKETAKVMSKIYTEDKNITRLAKKLTR